MARTPYRDTFTTTSHSRPSTSDSSTSNAKREIWSTLLSDVANNKRLPEKHLLVLGGTPEHQKDFLDALQQDVPNRSNRPNDRSKLRKPALANKFALGYTYQDIYDTTDHEDVLARLSLYTLSTPSPAYIPLLSRLLTPHAIPHTALVILLDWNKPWLFIRQLRAWIRLVKMALADLSVEASYALEDNVSAWQQTRDANLATSMTDGHAGTMPLGPGEYDDKLGLPLIVCAQNALAIEALEKGSGWREEHFDFTLQFLRTVLLKHGAGLVYLMPDSDAVLQGLVHTALSVQSGGVVGAKEGAAQRLRHNVVDRERVLVPPGWDSWGKIRVLREGFDVEGISRAWGVEVQAPSAAQMQAQMQAHAQAQVQAQTTENTDEAQIESPAEPEPEAEDLHDGADEETDTTVALYEQQISDPHPPAKEKPHLEVPFTLDQQFLATQLERLEAYRAEDEAAIKKAQVARRGTVSGAGVGLSMSMGMGMGMSEKVPGSAAMEEYLGPVQMNRGGVSYDVEEQILRLKERSRATTSAATSDRAGTRTPNNQTAPFSHASPPGSDGTTLPPTENLEAYFASLMKGGRGGSAVNSPRPARGASQ